MLKIGIPLQFIEWLKAWPIIRVTHVKVSGSTARSQTCKKGLPQGLVISLLLFTIFTNDLLGFFNSNTLVSVYANDLALVKRSRNKGEVAVELQAEVDKVVRWSTDIRHTQRFQVRGCSFHYKLCGIILVPAYHHWRLKNHHQRHLNLFGCEVRLATYFQ